jgi:hypothetical protein
MKTCKKGLHQYEDHHKFCPECRKLTKQLWYQDNKDRARKSHKKWQQANREWIKNDALKVNYNFSLEEYKVLLEKQHGCCAICHKPSSDFKKSLHVDHCHTTSKVRGLLCSNCNRGLGHFQDNVLILQNAIKYLEDTQYVQ